MSSTPESGVGKRGSLSIVGTGIRLVAQTTPEARACIERADKLLYLVADGATEQWLQRLNGSAESLQDCYDAGPPRQLSYAAMVDRILGFVRRELAVCAAFYGHPGVFVHPSHEAVRRARAEGFSARMLPGISAEACLFADLGVDPAASGWQSFEATDFLVSRRRHDPASHLVLWQVGMIGESGIAQRPAQVRRGLRVLVEALEEHYPVDHEVVLYEAAQLPGFEPLIAASPLGDLPERAVSMSTTLLVPPGQVRPPDRAVAERLGLR